jgi:hypothetical protein
MSGVLADEQADAANAKSTHVDPASFERPIVLALIQGACRLGGARLPAFFALESAARG